MACSRLAVALCLCLGIGVATPDGWRRCELGSCQDERADCSALAERGMCFSDPAFMDANCKKACGQCPAAVPTACDGNATCCRHPFSNSGVGCCPFGSGAVCCNDYTCCPAGTACRDSGSGYRVTTRCVQPRTGSAVAQGKQICKPGAALPLSAVQRNCLIIGDSVSIGYTPAVNRLLSGTPGGCMVQHSPFSGDGGAEETAYGLQCLEYFIRSADGEEIAPRLDLIYFNWGLHNLVPDSESVVPGQSGHQADYLPNLANITARLSALRSRFGVRLLFGLTSPEMCEASQDDVVVRLNAQARELMAAERIPTVDLHAAVVGACGRPPQGTCLGKAGGGCPHYSPAGYEWIANSTLVPAFRAALSDGAAKPMAECESVAGCRVVNATDIPRCAQMVKLVPASIAPRELAKLDRIAENEIKKLPLALLPRRCSDALKTFICTASIGSCSYGQQLHTCQSICTKVHRSCSPLIRSAMPPAAKNRLKCGQYTQGSWPECAEPPSDEQAKCTAHANAGSANGSACTGRCCYSGLLEEPCGVCSRVHDGLRFDGLPLDKCGVCNGDSRSCDATGCDGANGSLDACAVCNGGAAMCRALDTDPGLLGRVAVATAAVVGGLAVAVAAPRPACRGRAAGRSSGGARPGPRLRRGLRALGAAPAAIRRYQGARFGALGLSVARHPLRVMIGTTLLALALGCGLFNMKVSMDPLALWLPANSTAALAELRWQSLTGQPRWRVLSVMLAPRGQRAVSVRKGLQQAMAVHEAIARLEVPAAGGDRGAAVGLLGPCLPSPGEDQQGCAGAGRAVLASSDGLLSPLRLWGHDPRALQEDPSPWRTLASALHDAGADEGFSAAMLRNCVSLGGAQEADGIRALQLTYLLDGSASNSATVAAWERAATERLLRGSEQELGSAWPAWRALPFMEQGLADELSKAVEGDVRLIVIGYTVMSIYMSLFLGKHRDFVRGRGALVAVSLIAVGLATLSAFGLCAAAGVPYNETVNIATFVLLGVGVDDAFIMIDALEHLLAAVPDEGNGAPESVERLVAAALEDCGSAIFLSSITNVLAFALSALTPLPALRSFCIYSSVGMVTDFFYQVTFFVAALTLDEKRRLAGRCSVAPWVVARPEVRGECFGCRGEGDTVVPTPKAQSSALLSPVGRAVVLLSYACTLALSTHSAFAMPVGLQVSDLVPSSSYIQEYFSEVAAHFPRQQMLVEVLVQHAPDAEGGQEGTRAVPLRDEASWRSLRALRQSLAATEPIGSGGVAPLWLDSFAEHLRLQGSPPMERLGPAVLEARLAAFVGGAAGAALERQGRLIQRQGTVAATRLRLLASAYNASTMTAVRATVAASGLGDAAFPHSPADIYLEQDAIMLRYTFQSVLWVMVAVLSMVMLVSASLGFVAVMAACVLSCSTHMFGWMAATGVPLNSLSLIPLLLSASLCIDYCTHVAHAFWAEPRGAAPGRVGAALRARGAAVANGGFSTALTQVCLFGGQSLVFTTFAKMMCGIVFVGLVHALVVLPVFLGFWPSDEERGQDPQPVPTAQKDPQPSDEDQDEVLGTLAAAASVFGRPDWNGESELSASPQKG